MGFLHALLLGVGTAEFTRDKKLKRKTAFFSFSRRGESVKRLSVVGHNGRSVAIFAALLYSIIAFSPAAFAGEMSVYLKVDDYRWSEYNNGVRLLQESGILVGPGFSYWKEFSNHVTLKPLAELFVGNVDYDGATQNGSPVTTKVGYAGVKMQCDAGRKFGVGEKSFLEPFGGLGLRAWSRDLQDSTTSSGTAATGYKEVWISAYTRVGVRGGLPISEETRFFAEGGVKLPFYNKNSVYFNDGNNNPDFTLYPGLQSSLFGEAGVTFHHFKASVSYDGLRFSRSHNVNTSIGSAYQPRSSGDLLGLKLGASF
jgi:hypothetical protein